jgi:3-oxoacyl-[acyl-carrier-protein] synthase II
MSERRSVTISGVGLLCPAGQGLQGLGSCAGGEVPGFRARDHIADRKSLKLMTRAVQLGISAVQLAVDNAGDLLDVPPHRRGIYVGASPQPGDPDALRPALEAAMGVDGFDMQRFARDGYPLIHPLWLVRGLSNNIIGFSAAIHDLQGVNANYCDGVSGGWNALREGALAVAEGRADWVVAGGADAWAAADGLLGEQACGDGAGFVVFRPGSPDVTSLLPTEGGELDMDDLGFLGAASGPVAFCRRWLSGKG